jgi:predicted nucleotidyltransferase
LGTSEDRLRQHPALGVRRARSIEKLQRVSEAFSASEFLADLPISVFCAGSLARQEIGLKSDLDVFVTADKDERLQRRLCEYTLFGELIALKQGPQPAGVQQRWPVPEDPFHR